MSTKEKENTGQLSRREFIGIGGALLVPALARASVGTLSEPVTMGLITDLHHDLIHDGKSRLTTFLAASRRAKADGIMQLGDFLFPHEKNQEVIDLFNQAHETSLHVIGNHDTDNDHTRQQCVDRWGMPARYYAHRVKGVWFIVLDGNDPGSPAHKGGYPAYIDPEQVDWLRAQLQQIREPIVIVSHQPLIGALAVDNAPEIQALLASAADRVVVAINGHTHVDSLIYESGIPYVTVNSASYFWIGDKFRHESYSKEIHAAHESMSRMCPYRDPLFTMMTIDPATLTVQLTGKPSKWVGKSPAELGFTDEYKPLRVGEEIVPYIRKRTVRTRKQRG
jgi:3',5'-cyclic-AMP phosphodiesterase